MPIPILGDILRLSMKIALHGCYDINNFGDVLLANILISRLREIGFENVSVPIREERKLRWLLKYFTTDYMVFGGGGYLRDGPSSLSSFKHLIKYLGPAIIMKIRGKKYSIIFPGVGPINTAVGSRMIKWLIDNASVVNLRDRESIDLVNSRSKVQRDIDVTCDLILGLKRDDVGEMAFGEASLLLGSMTSRRLVGVHLESLMPKPKLMEAIIEKLVVESQRHDEISLCFFADHNPKIHYLYESIMGKYPKMKERYKIIPLQSIQTTAALIGSFNAVITTKLHVGITAYALGVMPYSAWTHIKTPRLYKMIGRSRFCSPAEHAVDSIVEWIDSIVKLDIKDAKEESEQRKEMFSNLIRKSINSVATEIRKQ